MRTTGQNCARYHVLISIFEQGSKISKIVTTETVTTETCGEVSVKCVFGLPLPAFLGGRGGASATGEDGQSVETLYI